MNCKLQAKGSQQVSRMKKRLFHLSVLLSQFYPFSMMDIEYCSKGEKVIAFFSLHGTDDAIKKANAYLMEYFL